MSTGITAIRPYFRARLNALGFREWKDGFNFENIPSTILDKSYHVEIPRGSRLNAFDMSSNDITQDVVVRVFFKGFRNPSEAIDLALLKYEQILQSVLASENRIGVDIKNIYFDSCQILPLSDSNDNAVILEITFSCLIIICI
jgi:hypothetical protein